MFVSHDRERLINALIYFAGETKFATRTKLFHLLYLLDFDHFRTTGRSVTGSVYEARHDGPVPVQVSRAWDDPNSYLCHAIDIVKTICAKHATVDRGVRREFDDTHFTRRQLSLMAELTKKYKEGARPDLNEVREAENKAFARVWNEGSGENQPIPYEFALSDSDPHAKEIRGSAHEARLVAKRSRPARGESA